jgi:alkanesulfonate monooxygenase SsuD/methylene tetrahydromethanopterin reductase-like flavin-dependent oxidoreductase (luciferase family)
VDIGIGLPTTIPRVAGATVLEWARRADAAQFSTLGTIDRVVYGNYDAVPAMAAAAAVTSTIRLTTAILIGPYRGNGALLAKQLASVDQLSGGRLVVGIAVGGREDDFVATGSDFAGRGGVQDALLAEMRAVWAGEPVVLPVPSGRRPCSVEARPCSSVAPALPRSGARPRSVQGGSPVAVAQ